MILTQVYWIQAAKAGRLAIMPRPRGGDWLEDEIARWKEAGIDTVVSLLERQEIAQLGLDQEAELCGARNIEFVSFPIPDRGVPESLSRSSAMTLRFMKAVLALSCRQ